MKKKKLILLVGLALLMQIRPTHAAASIANLQASLEALKTKLATLAQALKKINQTYTPVDELSPSQKMYFDILVQLSENDDQKLLAEKMQEYAEKSDIESLKTFIGFGYESVEKFDIWIKNLYNGMLKTDEVITDQAAKKALPLDQLFSTSDALKKVIQGVVPVGPMTPKRDNVWNPNPNPNPSTAKTYADLDADQKAAYDELDNSFPEVGSAAPGIQLQGRINTLKGLIKRYADPNNNGFEGLKTFIADKNSDLKAIKDKMFQKALDEVEKQLAANQQSDSGDPSSSGNDSGQTASDPVYNDLEKAWATLVSAQGNLFAVAKAEPTLKKLMEKNAQDGNTEPLKKFIKAHYNENKAFFDFLKEPLKKIVAEAKP